MSRDAVEDFIVSGRTNPRWECDHMPEINPFEGFIRIRDAVPLTGKSLEDPTISERVDELLERFGSS